MLALTGYELALALVALAFIAFALVVALVIPRSRPAFPGNRLGLFIAICGVFFVAQMTAVLVLAEIGEADEPVEEQEAGGGEGEEQPPPGEPPPGEEPPPEAGGSTAVGKEIFLGESACGSCHTLADAGTDGAIGPNLDATMPSAALVVDRVTNGQGGMPAFADSLSEEEIQEVAAYVSAVAGG